MLNKILGRYEVSVVLKGEALENNFILGRIIGTMNAYGLGKHCTIARPDDTKDEVTLRFRAGTKMFDFLEFLKSEDLEVLYKVS